MCRGNGHETVRLILDSRAEGGIAQHIKGPLRGGGSVEKKHSTVAEWAKHSS